MTRCSATFDPASDSLLFQMPAGDVSEWACKRLGPRWGNVVMWFSILVGQPAAVLLYLRDYVLAHDGPAGLAVYASMA